MSDERTHGAESAIDDDLPTQGLDADDIREASIQSGMLVRAAVEALPDSDCKTEFLRFQSELEDFWRNKATDAFCRQWLLVALSVGS